MQAPARSRSRCSRLMKIMLALPFMAGGCQNTGRVVFHEDPAVVKESIKKLIPPGSDITRAEEIMVKNDFTCSHMKKSTFLDKENLYHNIDFIYCDRSCGLIVSRRWQVAIVHKNFIVQDVYVSTGLTGP